jgi:hypothetical protein
LSLSPDVAGKTVRCPRCQTVFSVPAASGGAAAVPVAQPAPPAQPADPGAKAPLAMRAFPDDNAMRIRSYPTDEEPARPTNWRRVRFGLDLVFFATLITIGALGTLVAIVTSTPVKELPDLALLLVGLQVLVLVAGFLQFYGQWCACEAPPEAGRAPCQAATWTDFGSFGLSVIQFLVAFLAALAPPTTPTGPGVAPKPATEDPTISALTWPIFGLGAVAAVCRFLFLHRLALYHNRPTVAGFVLASMISMLGYAVALVVLLATGTLADKTLGEGTQMLLLLFVGGGGLAVIGLYLGVLITVRNLIVVKKKPRPASA